jgi:hypothetical protein
VRRACNVTTPPPFGDRGLAGGFPGEGPSAVGLLVFLQPVEVGIDLGVGEQRAPPGGGLWRDIEWRQAVARRVDITARLESPQRQPGRRADQADVRVHTVVKDDDRV